MTSSQSIRLLEYFTVILTLEVEVINDPRIELTGISAEMLGSHFLDAAMFGTAYSIDGVHIPIEQVIK